MFEKFTEGAIKVIMLSQEESRRMGHNFVGTEQLLLGMIGQRYGIAAKVLKKAHVTIRRTRKEIELYIGRGKGFVAAEIPFTPRAKRVLEMAVHEARDFGQNFVGPEHILLAVIAEGSGVAVKTLKKFQVNLSKLRRLTIRYIEKTHEETIRPFSPVEQFLLERSTMGSASPTLEEYSENLSTQALDGNLDPVIGREKEILDVITVLARRTKNNPVLVGEPGVGKTAVAEGLAQLIVAEQVPDFLEGSLILALDMGSILAGTKYRGEFEERLKKIVEEVEEDSSVLVVIDEIHNIVGAGAAEGAVDAANILKPALARGKFRCIGATTNDEYRKYIERDPALERRFQPVHVEEPSVGITIQILQGLRRKFEQHHGLTYSEEAIEQAAILANKYVADRYLPDKAIDVLDESGARVRLQTRNVPLGLKKVKEKLQTILHDKEEAIKEQNFILAQQLLEFEMEVKTNLRVIKQSLSAGLDDSLTILPTSPELPVGSEESEFDLITETDVADVIANWTGIPVAKLTGSESERLLRMEDTLHERIIGQHQAVVSVSKAIRRARVGLRNPNRPIASFIFAGPTGVGKTELTKTLSDYMFGSETSMIRLDMSEYMEKHTVAKLIGAPPGYVGYTEGGQLTEAVRSKPYSVVLFDEVEKAHPDVFNLLLQILDDGRLSDSKGRVVDFTNTLIIMTTNLGAKIIERESGIKSKSDLQGQGFKLTPPQQIWDGKIKPDPVISPEVFERVAKLVNEELKNFFRPEFLNRIDEIIVFRHLTRQDIWEICGLMLKALAKRLEEKGIILRVDRSAQGFLVEEGYDPIYGARPLRRAIMTHLEDTLSEKCLTETLYPNTQILVARKKVPKTLNTYFNELEVTLDFSNVDPRLLATRPATSERQETQTENRGMKQIPTPSNNLLASATWGLDPEPKDSPDNFGAEPTKKESKVEQERKVIMQ